MGIVKPKLQEIQLLNGAKLIRIDNGRFILALNHVDLI